MAAAERGADEEAGAGGGEGDPRQGAARRGGRQRRPRPQARARARGGDPQDAAAGVPVLRHGIRVPRRLPVGDVRGEGPQRAAGVGVRAGVLRRVHDEAAVPEEVRPRVRAARGAAPAVARVAHAAADRVPAGALPRRAEGRPRRRGPQRRDPGAGAAGDAQRLRGSGSVAVAGLCTLTRRIGSIRRCADHVSRTMIPGATGHFVP
mmetsp:Transcript_22584/g.70016  ORF Transcript_22584/g.70016 Transcript_22584/m.70016 type:complete len:206 (-) Transcript_22584:42-659(-)